MLSFKTLSKCFQNPVSVWKGIAEVLSFCSMWHFVLHTIDLHCVGKDGAALRSKEDKNDFIVQISLLVTLGALWTVK